MVKNSTKINIANNHLSPQLLNIEKTLPLTLEIQVLSWDRNAYVDGLNWLLRSKLMILIL